MHYFMMPISSWIYTKKTKNKIVAERRRWGREWERVEDKKVEQAPIILTINGWKLIIYLVKSPNVDGWWCCFYSQSISTSRCILFFFFEFYVYLCNSNFRIHCFRSHFFCSDSWTDGLFVSVFYGCKIFCLQNVCCFVWCILQYICEPQNRQHCDFLNENEGER